MTAKGFFVSLTVNNNCYLVKKLPTLFDQMHEKCILRISFSQWLLESDSLASRQFVFPLECG